MSEEMKEPATRKEERTVSLKVYKFSEVEGCKEVPFGIPLEYLKKLMNDTTKALNQLEAEEGHAYYVRLEIS